MPDYPGLHDARDARPDFANNNASYQGGQKIEIEFSGSGRASIKAAALQGPLSCDDDNLTDRIRMRLSAAINKAIAGHAVSHGGGRRIASA